MKKEEGRDRSSLALALAIVGLCLGPIGWILASLLFILFSKFTTLYGGLIILIVVLALPAIIGLVIGIKQYKKSKDKSSLWAIVLSIIALVLLLTILIILMIYLYKADVILNGCLIDPSQTHCAELFQSMASGGSLQ